jgi:alanyl-tRNA synthetase
MTSAEIRRQYIDFFVKKHGHSFVPSSSVVPHDDPTLLFTNAGMNQFKPYFLGTQAAPWKRVANSQKCIHAGGKHNDLEDVGRSRRHGTFFEMLGNWSFGDYFKRGAIEMAWELITQVYKLDPTRIHVTCFGGDEANGVPRDTEAAELWKQIAGFPDDHIHFLGEENFWEMGPTGPCGPCTEIFIDRTPDKTGGPSVVSGDDPRVMEFWNNVFIQYNRNPDRSLTPLPAQHVDTGMGFERISSILQNKEDMYGIDLFSPFFECIGDLSGFKYGGKYPKDNTPDPIAEAADAQLRHDIAFRVIADHMRTLTFALTDGAVPSNEGRGYVLRRILRRAVRFGRQQLEMHEPFLHKLVEVVVDSMGEAFPELRQNPRHVADLIHGEEVSFGKTLETGLGHFWSATTRSVARSMPKGMLKSMIGPGWAEVDLLGQPDRLVGGPVIYKLANGPEIRVEQGDDRSILQLVKQFNLQPRIDAGISFKLHDTYGFPIDLTQLMAGERGMSVDIAGYETLMEEARQKARAGGREADSPVYDLSPAVLAELQRSGAKPTDDSAKYRLDPIEARVVAIWNGSNLDPSADPSEDQEIAVILDRTNFYAEQGGQVGDAGTLATASSRFDVETTRVVGGYVLHVGRVRSGKISTGDSVQGRVSGSRPATMQSHTGTHLLNWALREVLGDGVQQKGSLVAPDRLRFDFSHSKPMTDDEIDRVDALVRQSIEKSLAVSAQVVPQEQALKIAGLRAVFGEKYPPQVRVVSIGAPVADLLKDPSNAKWRQFSIEFCGGTHLGSSSEVGSMVITTEESVSKGVRRLVALTGEAASAAATKKDALESALARAGLTSESELAHEISAIQKLLGDEGVPLLAKRQAQKGVSELQAKLRAWEKSPRAPSVQVDVASVALDLLSAGNVVVAPIVGASDEQLRSVIDSIKKRSPSFAALLGSAQGDKVSFVAAVSDDLIAKGLKAGDWIRETARVAGGGGGGRPQLAQAGGKDPSKLADALEVARRFAREKLAK